jgi:hypothetical protein
MKKLFGPTPAETKALCWVASDADKLLDAYLDNKVTAEIVKSLTISLNEALSLLGPSEDEDEDCSDYFESRAMTLDHDWDGARPARNRHSKQFVLEIEDVPPKEAA